MSLESNRISPCIRHTFLLGKSCLKFGAYITREHKISKFFYEAFTVMKTNDILRLDFKNTTQIEHSKKLLFMDT